MWITGREMCSCYMVLLFYLIGTINALNCHSDGGPKEEELKIIYQNCLKRQDRKNTSDFRGYDDDWREPRGHNQRSHFERGNRYNERENKDRHGNDRMNRDDMSSRDDRMNRHGDDDGMSSNDRNRDDRMNRNDRNSRDDRMGTDGRNGRNDMMGSRDDRHNDRDQMGARDDFENSEEYGNHRYSSYRSTQPSRRYRRDRRFEMNSGQRSQYNPNTQKSSGKERSYRNERNSSQNSSRGDEDKACALQCFLENLEMTGDNGMPDKYLVTHAITKDVQNEDLRDFLQESIEECFQILDNENTEDKCEFSKNLLLCLSEKGRANCDDWKNDIRI